MWETSDCWNGLAHANMIQVSSNPNCHSFRAAMTERNSNLILFNGLRWFN